MKTMNWHHPRMAPGHSPTLSLTPPKTLSPENPISPQDPTSQDRQARRKERNGTMVTVYRFWEPLVGRNSVCLGSLSHPLQKVLITCTNHRALTNNPSPKSQTKKCRRASCPGMPDQPCEMSRERQVCSVLTRAGAERAGARNRLNAIIYSYTAFLEAGG